MKQNLGPQYSKDKTIDKTGFLQKARFHQSNYRACKLEVSYDTYGNYLTKKDAINGLNFYDDFNIFQEVKKRYPKYSKPLYANMLRSEHIGYNLFVPFKSDLQFCKNVFNDLLNGQIKSIDMIKMEYAPYPNYKYLNDKTAFDTYIEYTHSDNQKGIIGIEVKYTEHEYRIKHGSKQEADILNKISRYYIINEKCDLYSPNTIEKLTSDKFRQIWRNQLLGESIIIEDSAKYKHFTSLTIFPKNNIHFVETSNDYLSMLKSNNNRFIPVTYEDFILICNQHSPNERFNKWIEYIHERYIIKN